MTIIHRKRIRTRTRVTPLEPGLVSSGCCPICGVKMIVGVWGDSCPGCHLVYRAPKHTRREK